MAQNAKQGKKTYYMLMLNKRFFFSFQQSDASVLKAGTLTAALVSVGGGGGTNAYRSSWAIAHVSCCPESKLVQMQIMIIGKNVEY